MTNINNKKVAIEIKNLKKIFSESGNNSTIVYDNFNLQLEEGKVTAVLGPNGCGKSTLLDIILGLENYDRGEIKILGKKGRANFNKVGVVFQGLGLFPWLTVKQNLVFGLKNLTSSRLESISNQYLEKYGMNKFANAPVSSLSGGMQQKLALARVLVTDPQVFILDEPFSSLDPFSKSKIIKEVKDINKLHEKTIIFITHSIQEALDLGQNIIVLSSKPIQKSYLFKNDKNTKEETAKKIKRIISLQ